MTCQSGGVGVGLRPNQKRSQAMAENKLNSRKIASFKTPGRLNDGAGLYLECRLGTDGALHRSWLFRYKHNGKPREMGLGSLSESNGLFEARQERNRWRT